MVFQCINIRQVPWEVFENRGRGLQHLPRNLANVNAWKTMFDPYIKWSSSVGVHNWHNGFPHNAAHLYSHRVHLKYIYRIYPKY